MKDDDFTKYMRGWGHAAIDSHVPSDEASLAYRAGHAAGIKARREAGYDASEWEHNAECEADEKRVEAEGQSDE